jgi:hypothetical protein
MPITVERPSPVENPVENLWRNAHSGIGKAQNEIRPNASLQVHPGIVFVNPKVLGGNTQNAALGHRIAGIDAKVHEHLMELSGICCNRL